MAVMIPTDQSRSLRNHPTMAFTRSGMSEWPTSQSQILVKMPLMKFHMLVKTPEMICQAPLRLETMAFQMPPKMFLIPVQVVVQSSSEDRRVGKEWVSAGRSGGAPVNKKRN